MNAFVWAGESDRLLMTTATINGVPGNFIVDTCAAAMMLHPRFAAKSGIEAHDEAAGRGAGGEVTVGVAIAKQVEFADRCWSDSQVGVLPDILRIEQALNAEVDGVLGYSLFQGYTLCFDFGVEKVWLSEDRALEGAVLTVSPEQPLLCTEAVIHGRRCSILVDTGASKSDFALSLVEELGLESSAAEALTGAGGQVEARRVQPVEVEMAGRKRVLNPTCSTYHETISEAIGVPVEAIIGLDFLKHFKVRVDYVSNLMSLD